jgi:hypothetical protein
MSEDKTEHSDEFNILYISVDRIDKNKELIFQNKYTADEERFEEYISRSDVFRNNKHIN